MRRQWRSALAVMIGVLILALSGVFISYLQVVGHYRTAAVGLDQAIALSSELTDAITAHEAVAHTLWNGDPVDRRLYLSQQADITALLQNGAAKLDSKDEQLLLAHAAETWRDVLVTRGLWGPSAAPRPGVTLAMQQQFGSDSDEVTSRSARSPRSPSPTGHVRWPGRTPSRAFSSACSWLCSR